MDSARVKRVQATAAISITRGAPATQGAVYWSLLREDVLAQLNVDGHDCKRLVCVGVRPKRARAGRVRHAPVKYANRRQHVVVGRAGGKRPRCEQTAQRRGQQSASMQSRRPRRGCVCRRLSTRGVLATRHSVRERGLRQKHAHGQRGEQLLRDRCGEQLLAALVK